MVLRKRLLFCFLSCGPRGKRESRGSYSTAVKVTPVIAPNTCGSGCPVKALLREENISKVVFKEEWWSVSHPRLFCVSHDIFVSLLTWVEKPREKVNAEVVFQEQGAERANLHFPLKISSFSHDSFKIISHCCIISASSAPYF